VLLCLFADCRSRGVEEATLEVRVSNAAAINLYRGFGLAPGGIRENYYADIGEDALIMWVHDLASPEAARRLARIEASLDPPLVTHDLPAIGDGARS
jgi:ribosomal-protein-alanine N-acetyltransferase